MDVFSKEKRSEVMSKIQGRDTKFEVQIRKYLFKQGFRFKKNVKSLPGKPDIVLKKHNTIVFINGCFWHGHKSCKHFKIPKTRTGFWERKIGSNIDKDARNKRELGILGWKTITLWECRLKKHFKEEMSSLEKTILLNQHTKSI